MLKFWHDAQNARISVNLRILENLDDWLGIYVEETLDDLEHFNFYKAQVKGKHLKTVRNLIWMKVLWCILLTGNLVLFIGFAVNVF